MTTADLIAEVDGFKELAVEVCQRLAAILVVLRKRRERHAFFQHPILRFFEAIADDTLDAEAAIILGNGALIKAVMHLPKDQQRAIAKGQEIAVATVQPNGRIGNENLPIQRMGTEVLKRVFAPEGIRSVQGQAAIIREKGKTEKHGMITVDRDHGRLRIGNQTFTPDEFNAAFLALGYKIVPARDVASQAG